jgi:molybdopterin-containing oxidoreductase family iron-sulfur binding subunit
MVGEHQKRYWKSLEERDSSAPIQSGEFPEELVGLDPGFTRRGFLKAAGFSFATAVLSGCQRGGVEKAIPFLTQPQDVVPGMSVFYASTCGACPAACGLLVKNRDGRPIKLEGNAESPHSRGALCAVGQASLLGLYDSHRFRGPQKDGKKTSWADIDREITAALDAERSRGGAVRLLTGTINSPTLLAAIGRFTASFPNARHVSYDAISSSAILDAHERTHGLRVLPHYRFDAADVIVGIDADFLGTWIAPVEFTRAYSSRRRPEDHSFSYHAQFEPVMTVTGANADSRTRIEPGDAGAILTQLASLLAQQKGEAAPFPAPTSGPATRQVAEIAGRLREARGKSLVVCGAQDVDTQVLCNYVNHLLGNYGGTLDIEHPSYQRRGNDGELASLLGEIRDGKVAVLMFAGVNPVYDLPDGAELQRAISAVPVTVSFAARRDETAGAVHYNCPDHHFLESWADAEPVAGTLSLTQPVIAPIFDTRAMIESLATWMKEPKSAYDSLKAHWETAVYPRAVPATPAPAVVPVSVAATAGEAPAEATAHPVATAPAETAAATPAPAPATPAPASASTFQRFWDRAVQDGVVKVSTPSLVAKSFDNSVVKAVDGTEKPTANALALVLYPTVGMRDGSHAYNAWLQELPDPVTKATWDNYVSLSPPTAAKLGLAEGDVVRVAAEGGDGPAIELPVLLQPGQHESVAAVALGYGAEASKRFGEVGPKWLDAGPTLGDNGMVGKNAAPFIELRGNALRYSGRHVTLTPTGRRRALAVTQMHHTLHAPQNLQRFEAGPRPIIEEMSVSQARAHNAHQHAEHPELWPPDHANAGPRWGLAIDLNTCTGCSACVIACQVENNVPVVGRDEVLRQREMHWIRIDRYYSGAGDDVDVAFQPMMCQQCEVAGCETVCPVLATVHSEDGLNQQVYNRCVGTRYCANNCAYKVRRFNWFDYPHEDRFQNLVLNPDVTVRSRGVMEKCSFCVQRIQAARIAAKAKGEPIADGAIQTACQQSCPANAIVFGDLADPNSAVSKLGGGPRGYKVLEELNVGPSVTYLAVVRNREEGSNHG